MHDDYAAALQAARSANKPIVIDMWAPWCHTCLSMQEYVLKDPGLLPLADRFVWLAIDTDRETAAPALAKFPVSAWPTFFVVSPADESVQARLVGAASVAQFRELLISGEAGHLDQTPGQDDPAHLARTGDRAALAGDWAAADAAYSKALAAAPADWRRRPDVLVSQISARYRAEDWEGCTVLGETIDRETGDSSSAADFLYFATMCAAKLGDEPRKKAMYTRAIKRLDRLVHDPGAPLSMDDRADAMRIERELMDELGDHEGARTLAEQQRGLLDEAAAKAPNAFVAMAYNWPRSEVYVYLGRGAELVPALEDSEKALPSQYDPPYRLAWLHLKLGNLDAAQAAAERALDRAYGPRKARVLDLLAEIAKARGDEVGEIAARRAIVELLEELPEGQRSEPRLAKARADLQALLQDE